MGTVVAEVFEEDAIPQTEEIEESEVEEDAPSEPLPTIDPASVVQKGDSFLSSYLETSMKHPTPKEYHLFLGLQALGLAVSNRVQLGDHDNVKGILPLILLGDTTAGKSRSLKPIQNEIILHPEGKLNRKWNPDGITVIRGAGSGEYLIEKFDDSDQYDKPFPVTGLIYFNELSLLSAKSSGASSAFKPIIMAFLDGDPYIDNGTRGNGEVSAYMPFGPMLTTTQPRDLKNTLTKSDMARGLVNRFLFICGTPKPAPAISRTLIDWTTPRTKLEAVHDWSLTEAMKTGGYVIIEKWEKEAEDRFQDFFDTKVIPLKLEDEKNGGGALGRLDLHMKRLVLLFAVNDMSTVIRLGHVESAISLFQYLVDCFAVAAGQVVTSHLSGHMATIVKKIEEFEAAKRDEETTKRNLYDRSNTRKAMNLEEWQAAIKALTAPGGGLYRNTTSGRKDGKGGRRTETFNTYKKGV